MYAMVYLSSTALASSGVHHVPRNILSSSECLQTQLLLVRGFDISDSTQEWQRGKNLYLGHAKETRNICGGWMSDNVGMTHGILSSRVDEWVQGCDIYIPDLFTNRGIGPVIEGGRVGPTAKKSIPWFEWLYEL